MQRCEGDPLKQKKETEIVRKKQTRKEPPKATGSVSLGESGEVLREVIVKRIEKRCRNLQIGLPK